MFTLLDSLLPYGNRELITNTQKKIGILLSALSITANKYSFASRQEKNRRKNLPRREIDKYKADSHEPYRYAFCGLNEQGERDPRNAKITWIIIHGLRGYAGLYTPLAEYYNAKGDNVLIMDFPEHGNNLGKRHRLYDPKYFENCVRAIIVEANKLNGDNPKIIIGFSWGALINLIYFMHSASDYIKRHIAGVVCLGMPLNVGKKVSLGEALESALSCGWVSLKNLFQKSDNSEGEKVPPWKFFCAPYLGKYLPWYKIQELCMDKENISHDRKVVEEVWNDDKIYKGPLPAGLAYIILKMANKVFSHLRDGGYERLGFPLFFARGEMDGTAELGPYTEGGIPIKNYPGFYHELLKGAGSNAVITDIDAWKDAVVLPSWPIRKQIRSLTKQMKRLNTAFFKNLP